MFSAWVLLFSLCGWLGLLDFGLGSALQFYAAKNRAEKRYIRLLAMRVALALTVSTILGVSLVYIFRAELVSLLFRSVDILDTDSKITAIFFCGSFAITSSLSGAVQKLLYGVGKGFIANLGLGTGQLATLTWIYVLTNGEARPTALTEIGIAHFVPPSIVWLILWSLFIRLEQPKAVFKIDNTLRSLIRKAIGFSGFAILSATVLRIDYLVLASVGDSRGIFEYNVIARFIGLPFFAFTAFLAALQPEFTTGVDLKKRFKKLHLPIALGAIAVGLGGIGLHYFSPYLVPLVAPGVDPVLNGYIVFLSTVYHILRVWTDSFAMVLLALGKLKFFWKIVPVQAVIGITLQLGLGQVFGTIGVLAGLCLSYVLTVSIILPIVARKTINESSAS